METTMTLTQMTEMVDELVALGVDRWTAGQMVRAAATLEAAYLD